MFPRNRGESQVNNNTPFLIHLEASKCQMRIHGAYHIACPYFHLFPQIQNESW